jgi:hypothetical protein
MDNRRAETVCQVATVLGCLFVRQHVQQSVHVPCVAYMCYWTQCYGIDMIRASLEHTSVQLYTHSNVLGLS